MGHCVHNQYVTQCAIPLLLYVNHNIHTDPHFPQNRIHIHYQLHPMCHHSHLLFVMPSILNLCLLDTDTGFSTSSHVIHSWTSGVR